MVSSYCETCDTWYRETETYHLLNEHDVAYEFERDRLFDDVQ